MKKTVFFMAMLAIASVSICTYGQELRPAKGLNGKWGFIDESGKVVIPFIFKGIGEFSEGLVSVMRGVSEWGFIDKTGKVFIQFIYDEAVDFSEGLKTNYTMVNLNIFFGK